MDIATKAPKIQIAKILKTLSKKFTFLKVIGDTDPENGLLTTDFKDVNTSVYKIGGS